MIVELEEPPELRAKAVAFGWEVLEARLRYSYETIALMWAQLRLFLLWRPRDDFDFAITFQRTSICSG